jgi:His/Glu/Gln/Arg/opine family amino acid ABC transporter permease subunit
MLMSDLISFLSIYLGSIVDYLPGFLKASLVVLQVSVVSILLSWICGLIAALGKSSPYKALNIPSSFYIWFIRGTPTLVQIFIVYFGLPQFGIRFSPYVAGVLALGVNGGPYVAEIIRSGLSAIPAGQMESCRALGMAYFLIMRRIILPQVIRIIIPPVTNEAITMLKNTSLLSTITVMELMLYTQVVISETFRPFDFYIMSTVMYLIMTTMQSSLATKVEKRYGLAYEEAR